MFGGRRGRNPFRKVLTDQVKIKEYTLNEAIKIAPKEFVAGLRERRPQRDERDLRRRIAEGRALSRGKTQS